MKIVLATGIYPPDIGGPATYVKELAAQLVDAGDEVRVVTYGRRTKDEGQRTEDQKIVYVSKGGGPFLRWWRYAKILRQVGHDADVIVAFSSVSCGVPLWMSRLNKPKRILRLGGDFLWERYTDGGGEKGLREWYEERTKDRGLRTKDGRRVSNFQFPRPNGCSSGRAISKWLMGWLLRSFDHIVFSTRWQEELYEEFYASMPEHSVIENALPKGNPVLHQAHAPFRLLFLGRFVAFKNLLSLLDALVAVPDILLTLVGSGPMESALRARVEELAVQDRVTFLPSQAGEVKQKILLEHDLLVLPSITEISPNTALEARSCGLPVLLSSATGLSASLTQGMMVRELGAPGQIVTALREAQAQYGTHAAEAASEPYQRGWKEVAQDWRNLLSSLS